MNFVFLTELNLNKFDGAESTRIIELSKIIIQNNKNNVFITSLYQDNINSNLVSLTQYKNILLLISSFRKSNNYLKAKFFSTKHKYKQIKNICLKISANYENTIFITYDFFSFFLEELLIIRYLKKRKYKIMLESNELALGIMKSYKPKNFRLLYFLVLYPFLYINSYISGKLYKKYDGIITISYFLSNHYKTNYHNKPIVRIPSLYPPINQSQNIPFDKKDGKFKIGYFGTLSLHRDLIGNIIEAAKILRHEHFFHTFIISLSGKSEGRTITSVKNLIREYSLEDNIKLYGFLPYDTLIKLQIEQDLLLILRNNDLQGNATLPTKLANYMHLGKPLLASKVSDIPFYIKDYYNGFVLINNDPNYVAEKILEISQIKKENLKQIGENALNTAKMYFTYNNYINDFRSFVNRVIDTKNSN